MSLVTSGSTSTSTAVVQNVLLKTVIFATQVNVCNATQALISLPTAKTVPKSSVLTVSSSTVTSASAPFLPTELRVGASPADRKIVTNALKINVSSVVLGTLLMIPNAQNVCQTAKLASQLPIVLSARMILYGILSPSNV